MMTKKLSAFKQQEEKRYLRTDWEVQGQKCLILRDIFKRCVCIIYINRPRPPLIVDEEVRPSIAGQTWKKYW